jgi:hypothetical protein
MWQKIPSTQSFLSFLDFAIDFLISDFDSSNMSNSTIVINMKFRIRRCDLGVVKCVHSNVGGRFRQHFLLVVGRQKNVLSLNFCKRLETNVPEVMLSTLMVVCWVCDVCDDKLYSSLKWWNLFGFNSHFISQLFADFLLITRKR